MTESHLSDDALVDLALSPGGTHPHLDRCQKCQRTMKELKAFTAVLREEIVWTEEEPVLWPEGGGRAAELRELAERLDDERQAAAGLMNRLIEAPETAEGRLRFAAANAGSLDAALEAAHRLLEIDPSAAYQTTLAAEKLAERIDWTRYPLPVASELRGRIFKERANALRDLGRFAEALEAIELAIGEYERTLVNAHPIAVAHYIAACIMREQKRFDEALRKAEESASVFADFADDRRVLHCRLLEGVIRSETGDPRGGRDVFLELLRMAQDDLPIRAQLHNNIGQLSIQLGDLELGATHLMQAIHLYGELGMKTERIRSKWGLARLLIRNGRFAEGIDRLREAESEFLAAGMQLVAALVALDRIEALFAVDESAAATAECREIYRRFSDAGITANALTALAYLEESLARGARIQPVVGEVRTYLERLPDEPALLFAPSLEPQ